MALSIHYIIKRTPVIRRMDAAYVKIIKTKIGYNDQGQAFIAAQTYSTHHRLPDGKLVRERSDNKYVTVITLLDKKMKARVSCSCPDFMYRWEVALNRRGSADIEFSNGAAPSATNPSLQPSCCKHIVALYNTVKHRLVPR